MIFVLRVFVGCSMLMALACGAGAIYCWINAPRNAKPGTGERFMRVGLWTNLTPEGNRLYRRGFVLSLAFLVLVAVATGLTQLQKML
jgi:hypothetical protein